MCCDCLQNYKMADDDLDIEAMLEAPYVNGVSSVLVFNCEMYFELYCSSPAVITS